MTDYSTGELVNDAAMPIFVALIFFVFMGLVFGCTGAMLNSGRITRNNAIGLRTRATLSSDEAWERGHKAGVLWVAVSAIGAVTAAVLGLIALFVTGFEPNEPTNAVVILSGMLAIIGPLIAAGIAADRAAKKVS
ncbi:SdpI family protein [Arthrobacter sp. 260]|uniref:SdpI family protein n=1 Tax=Arthrobacter sp. 260 TaxID=2735314 RepID=UPI00149246A4|nr:SdpI family protein [Arthrobacter sp. 260]NOJ60914.1 SdpI family protein [Arthrobacter sp. 260]